MVVWDKTHCNTPHSFSYKNRRNIIIILHWYSRKNIFSFVLNIHLSKNYSTLEILSYFSSNYCVTILKNCWFWKKKAYLHFYVNISSRSWWENDTIERYQYSDIGCPLSDTIHILSMLFEFYAILRLFNLQQYI